MAGSASGEVATSVADNPPTDGRVAPAARHRMQWPQRLAELLSRYGTIVGLAVLITYFWVASPAFMTARNWNNILQAGAVMGVMAAGLTVVLILLDFDLSVGFVATASGMAAAGVAQSAGLAGGMAAAIALGGVVGLLNGLVVTRLHVSAFIATLAAGQILQGWLLAYRSGVQISTGLPDDFAVIGQGKLGPVPWLVVIWAAICLFLYVVLEHTVLGRRLYAVGGNARAARLSGIPVERMRVIAFTISGLSAGFAGLLLASNLDAGNPTAGLGYLLPAFAACFIGAATLRTGQFHIGGTVVGVITLGVLSNGLVLVGVSPAWTTAAQGLVLIGAVALSGFFQALGSR